jgi:hypothetical protein
MIGRFDMMAPFMPTRRRPRKAPLAARSLDRQLLSRLMLAAAALYAAQWGASKLWRAWEYGIRLEPGASLYGHDGLVRVTLATRSPGTAASLRRRPPSFSVLKDGRVVATIGKTSLFPLSYDASTGRWAGAWPCPWNAPQGVYTLAIEKRPDLAPDLRAGSFRIQRRRPEPLKPGFVALTLESVQPLKDMRVRAPDGTFKNWTGLLDWAQYVGADAFWVLGGQSPGLKKGEIWNDDNVSLFPAVGRECHRRGMQFGIYVQCYLTMGRPGALRRYEYALDVSSGHPALTRAISLDDPHRVEDLIKRLKDFGGLPEVDFLGLDYIRNALGGYELADAFYRDMPFLKPPPGWSHMTRSEKILAFARKKIARRDAAFIDAWQWWRAHKVAGIVRRIKKAVGPRKPLWTFTLSWDKGWHHGQDPVMMNDAGADIDAVMLYEANDAQYAQIMKDWRSYVRRQDVQLAPGDIVDWWLHQHAPDGPEEFYRRLKLAIDTIYADGRARAVFYHDIARALHGNLGPWTTKDWMNAARRVTEYLRKGGGKR